jgi:glucose-6-phosphate isomerase
MAQQSNEWMRLRVDVNNMFDDFVGEGNGITSDDITALVPRLAAAHEAIQNARGTGMMGWMNMPYEQDAIVADILDAAREIRENFDAFVVLGIGGSALGPTAIQFALNHMRWNELSKQQRNGFPKLYVEDNVDPERLAALFDVIDLKRTAFNVISKSGATSETMSQFLIIRNALMREVGDSWAKHIYATTDKERGNLIKIVKAEGMRMFVIPDGVGGRFSEICPVGLLPAAVCGIDIRAMLEGCAYMDQLCRENDISKNPAMLGAATKYAAMQKGKNISVIMPYVDCLKYMADWYAQLWAESLGKKFDRQGNEVRVGQTPVKSLGVTDQHSQVQLYAEGPRDKFVTFVGVDAYRQTMPIPDGYDDIPDVAFLGGHTQNELIAAEQTATEFALLKQGKMSRTITLPQVNAFTIGELMYFFMMETAYCGELLDINAYDQPGVEEGKNATYALLGRPGYEEKRTEIMARPAKNPRWII